MGWREGLVCHYTKIKGTPPNATWRLISQDRSWVLEKTSDKGPSRMRTVNLSSLNQSALRNSSTLYLKCLGRYLYLRTWSQRRIQYNHHVLVIGGGSSFRKSYYMLQLQQRRQEGSDYILVACTKAITRNTWLLPTQHIFDLLMSIKALLYITSKLRYK